MYILFLVLGLVDWSQALDNGLALTPPMGWLTWLRFGCTTDCKKSPNDCISENLIKRTADLMVSEGYLAAGYNYIGIDDCWMEQERSPDGELVPDKNRFPSGMKALADYVHSKGLKFGIYEDYGNLTCQGYPGVMGHEQTDVDTLVGWDVDYIKLDGCYSTDEERHKGYPDFGKRLNASGRPILYSCSWPAYEAEPDYKAIAKSCNLWRNTGDISASWKSLLYVMNWFADHQDQIQRLAGPGQWNDPDMLVIGNPGITCDQARVQMAVWAVLAAPLLMSTDLATMPPEFKEILLNRDIIAVSQDRLGRQGLRVTVKGTINVWTRELSDNCYAVAFVNHNEIMPAADNFTWKEMGVPARTYIVKDLFKVEVDQTLRPKDTLTTYISATGVTFTSPFTFHLSACAEIIYLNELGEDYIRKIILTTYTKK